MLRFRDRPSGRFGRTLVPILAAACAACSGERSIETAPAPSPQPPVVAAPSAKVAPASAAEATVAVDGEGLRLVSASGRARPLPFGTAEAEVLTTLERLRGPAETGVNGDCGVRFAGWSDGLNLVFEDGRFTGWWVDGRAKGGITTVSGVGAGAKRSALDVYADVAVTESTLGREFTAGGMAGLVDGPGADAEITHLWAGRTCVAR